MFKKNPSGFARFLSSGLIATLAILRLATAHADEAIILNATAEVQTNSLYAFSVTLTHPDEGWSHYVDSWVILDQNGNELGKRTLYHPHGNNEPFTRSLANVSIPIGLSTVSIRTNCSIDGPSLNAFTLELPPR